MLMKVLENVDRCIGECVDGEGVGVAVWDSVWVTRANVGRVVGLAVYMCSIG